MKKERNTFPIGLKQIATNTITWHDISNGITSEDWRKKKYFTLFGREFKFWDKSVITTAKVVEDKMKVGF